MDKQALTKSLDTVIAAEEQKLDASRKADAEQQMSVARIFHVEALLPELRKQLETDFSSFALQDDTEVAEAQDVVRERLLAFLHTLNELDAKDGLATDYSAIVLSVYQQGVHHLTDELLQRHQERSQDN